MSSKHHAPFICLFVIDHNCIFTHISRIIATSGYKLHGSDDHACFSLPQQVLVCILNLAAEWLKENSKPSILYLRCSTPGSQPMFSTLSPTTTKQVSYVPATSGILTSLQVCLYFLPLNTHDSNHCLCLEYPCPLTLPDEVYLKCYLVHEIIP